jgi:hypothetical protein
VGCGERALRLRSYLPFNANYEQWVTGSTEDNVRVWDLGTGTESAGLAEPYIGCVLPTALALAPNGCTLATGATNGVVYLWDFPARQKRCMLLASRQASKGGPSRDKDTRWPVPVEERADNVHSLAFSPDSSQLVTLCSDGTARLRDTATGQERFTLEGSNGETRCAAFGPDNRTLAVSRGNQLEPWDTTTGHSFRTLTGHREPIFCVAFAPEGKALATGGQDRQVKLWDWHSEREPMTLVGHTDTVASLAFTPDGKTLASGSWDRTVRLWHPASAQEVTSLLGHNGPVSGVAFSSDGKTLARGGTVGNSGEVFLRSAAP